MDPGHFRRPPRIAGAVVCKWSGQPRTAMGGMDRPHTAHCRTWTARVTWPAAAPAAAAD